MSSFLGKDLLDGVHNEGGAQVCEILKLHVIFSIELRPIFFVSPAFAFLEDSRNAVHKMGN